MDTKQSNGYVNLITLGKMVGRINGQRRGYLFLNLLFNGKKRVLIFKFTKWKKGKRNREIIVGRVPLEGINKVIKKAQEIGKINASTRQTKRWELVDHTKGEKFTKKPKKTGKKSKKPIST